MTRYTSLVSDQFNPLWKKYATLDQRLAWAFADRPNIRFTSFDLVKSAPPGFFEAGARTFADGVVSSSTPNSTCNRLTSYRFGGIMLESLAQSGSYVTTGERPFFEADDIDEELLRKYTKEYYHPTEAFTAYSLDEKVKGHFYTIIQRRQLVNILLERYSSYAEKTLFDAVAKNSNNAKLGRGYTVIGVNLKNLSLKHLIFERMIEVDSHRTDEIKGMIRKYYLSLKQPTTEAVQAVEKLIVPEPVGEKIIERRNEPVVISKKLPLPISDGVSAHTTVLNELVTYFIVARKLNRLGDAIEETRTLCKENNIDLQLLLESIYK